MPEAPTHPSTQVKVSDITADSSFAQKRAEITQQVRSDLLMLIDGENRRINRYDPASPRINDAIKNLLMTFVEGLVKAEFDGNTVPSGSHRQKYCVATEVRLLQEAMEEVSLIASYKGSKDEVLATLAGTPIRLVVEAMDKHGLSVPVDEDTVKLLTDMDRSAIRDRRAKYSYDVGA